MKESLIEIVKCIDSCEKISKAKRVNPISRVHMIYDGIDDIVWFTNQLVNIHKLGDLQKYGRFVHKNSIVAIKLQTNDVGSSFEYECYNTLKRKQRHSVIIENRSDLQNNTIIIANDKLKYQYRNISEFLKALKSNQEEIIDIAHEIAELEMLYEGQTPQQKRQTTISINLKKEKYRILTQQQEELKNITIYIRKQGEMRYSLIVDPVQTRIKTQNLFDGRTLIINGGPGTGKSTTMIHRLAYLTDISAIKEDKNENLGRYKLNNTQRKQLIDTINNQRDWMFFSPSKLLKDYLADAMRKEGLKNTSNKVWNWRDYCKLILQEDYKLLETKDTKAPFCISKFTDTLFYQNSNIINEFTMYFLEQYRKIKSDLPKINTSEKLHSWSSIAVNIAKRFDDAEKYDLHQFVVLFNSLEFIYGKECRRFIQDNRIAIKALANNIYNILVANNELKRDIEDIFSLSSESIDSDTNEFALVEIDETQNANQDDAHSIDKTEENKFLIELQKWVKAYCGYRINDAVSLSDEYQLISEIIQPLLGEKYNLEIQKIGQLIVFEQFAKYTKGVKALMLNVIPSCYRNFRAHLIKTKFEGCNLKLLRELRQRKQGKDLHHQEQSLLLGFINSIVKRIKSNTHIKIKHNYISAYEKNSRPIIGVDEATDFSACDIYAINSFLTQDFYSLTLCGDMMQRMTAFGIKSWNELNGIVNKPLVEEMRTSYRQSKKLLNVAKNIYKDTLGETPKYRAFMLSEKVPAPLVYIDENEFGKIEWISKRISEVYRAYGECLPSIAIFINDKGYISKFIQNLQSTDFFKSKGIAVLDGMNEKSKENYISIYPIEVVKGMEFDVVFFHNIDNSSADIDILKRYIYVGVSRAAFFLGITLSEYNHEICKYFEKNKDWFNI